MMNYDEVKQKNLEYFTGLLNDSDDQHAVVAQSKISHLKRFEILLELGDFNNKRVLDVGCGIGGYWEFLQQKGISCDYTGIDINPHMISKAKDKYPNIEHKFFVCDIIEQKLDESYDFVISNGPLNLKFDDNLNMDMTLQLMKAMYRLANTGCAITMTSALTRKPNNETFYYEPEKILSETFKYCANVKFAHTYLPHDFTVFCYKKDLYDF
jgi:SAM-dependent methyltransferase